jgi:TrmH family RNA methyltransferase
VSRVWRIESPQNPRVKAVRSLRRRRERDREGLLIAEGWREVERAWAAGLSLHRLFWCAERVGEGYEDLRRRLAVLPVEPPNAELCVLAPEAFRRTVYRDDPEGVVGIFAQPRWRLADVLSQEQEGGAISAFCLIAVGLEKPGNLGAMVRTADAAGARGVIAADGIADPFNANAIRASTGAVCGCPVVTAAGSEVRAALAEHGWSALAAEPRARRVYTEADCRGPLALLVGAEDRGLEDGWRGVADRGSVRIPMRGAVADSLNAAVTAAILLMEAARGLEAPGFSSERPDLEETARA